MRAKILLFFVVLLASCGSGPKNPNVPFKVAVVDSGLDLTDSRFSSHLCTEGHEDFTGEGLTDNINHGTAITSLIIKHAAAANYCLIILKVFDPNEPPYIAHYNSYLAMKKAVKLGVEFINYSGGGNGYDDGEANNIANNPDVKFVVAAGNDGENLDTGEFKFYPASLNFPNVIAVGSIRDNGTRSPFSNHGPTVDAVEIGSMVYVLLPNNREGYMSGTSISTAVHTGKLVKEAYDRIR